MKLKIVVVDLELPPRAKKRAVLLMASAAVFFGGGAIAYASGLLSWSDGQTLTAGDLNANFNYIQSEIQALQTAAPPHRTTTGFAGLPTDPGNDILCMYESFGRAFNNCTHAVEWEIPLPIEATGTWNVDVNVTPTTDLSSVVCQVVSGKVDGTPGPTSDSLSPTTTSVPQTLSLQLPGVVGTLFVACSLAPQTYFNSVSWYPQ